MRVDLKRLIRAFRKVLAAGAIAAVTLAGGAGSAHAALVLSNGSFASPNVGTGYGYYNVGSHWNVHNLGPSYGGGDNMTGNNGNLVHYAQNNVDAGLASGSQYAAAVLWDTPAQVFSQPAGTVLSGGTSGTSGMYVDQTLGTVTSTDQNASFTLSADLVRILANPTVAGAGVTIGFANATTGLILAEKSISYSSSYAANDPTTVNIADALAWSPLASGLAIGTPVSAFIGFRLDPNYSNQYNSVALASLVLADNIKTLTWTGADPTHPTQWSTSSGVLNWSSGGTASAYSDGLHTVFDDSVGAGSTTVNISAGNVAPASVTFNNNAHNYTLSGAYGITGNTGLALTGSDMVTITNSNNFTGDTTISSGTLQLGSGASGQDGVIASSILINNSVLLYNLAGSQTASYTSSGTGSVIKTGSGTLTFNNAQGYTGGTIVNGGTLALGIGGYGGTVLGTLTINPGAVVKLNASDALGYGSGNCVTSVNVNNGTIDNSTGGNNAFITNFTLAGGTMSSSGGGTYNFSTGYGITTNANTATSLISSGITIRDDNGANNMAFNIASGSTASGIDLVVSGKIAGGTDCSITMSGAGVMALTGVNTYAGATNINGGTLQLGDGTTGHDGTINATSGVTNSATLVYNLYGNQSVNYAVSGGGNLTKLGQGQLTLTGNNSYSGTTTVAGGILNINGADNSTGISANGGAVYVNVASPATSVSVAGGATLGGTGSLTSGTANVANGGILDFSQNAGSTFMLAGVNYAGSGTLNLGALTAGNANVSFLQSLGAFTTAGQININANLGAASVLSGTYDLVNYASIAGTGTSAFHLSVNGLGTRQTATLVDVSNQLEAVIGGQTPYWSGSQPDWRSTDAWTLQPSGNPTTFQAGDADIFDDSAGTGTYGGLVVLNSGNIAPSSVTFNNLGLSYNVSGSYGITGSGALAVQGGGSVTLLNSNSYTGATIVSNGTLQLGNGGATGSLSSSSAIALGSNGVLAFSRSNNVVQGVDFGSSPISGAGSVVQNGPGDLIFTANNNYGGTTTIKGGTLSASLLANGGLPSSIGASSSAASNFVLQGGAVFQYAGPSVNIDRGFTVGAGGAVIDIVNGTQLQFGSSLVLGGTLTKNDSGTLQLTNYTGSTVGSGGMLIINQGTVDFGGSYYSASPFGFGALNIQVNPGGNLLLSGYHALGGDNADGNTSWGVISVLGGTMTLDHEQYIHGGTVNGLGRLILQGGTVNMGNLGPGPSYEFRSTSNTSTVSTLASAQPSVINVNLNAAYSSFVLDVARGTAPHDLMITGDIYNSFGITKVNNGLLELTGSDTYAGDTTVNGGTLLVGSAAAIPYGAGKGNVALGGSGTFDLGGLTTNINGLSGAGTVDNSASTAVTLDVGNNDATSTFSGVLQNSNTAGSGFLALTKTGSGTLTLSGTNTYKGGTTVSDGTLVLTNNEAIADGTSLTVGNPLDFAAPVVPSAAVPATVVPVPEPGTLGLLAAGVTVAFFAVRRRSWRVVRR